MRPARVVVVAGVALAVSMPIAAAASCAGQTEAEARDRADVVFQGVAQPGPQVESGFLVTPLRFSVLSYLKGSGPAVLSVDFRESPGGTNEGVHSGDRWVIYGTGSPDAVVVTTVCHGSHLVGAKSTFLAQRTTPSPAVAPPVSAPVVPSEVGWGVKTAAGVVGLALVMAIGYGAARVVVRTE